MWRGAVCGCWCPPPLHTHPSSSSSGSGAAPALGGHGFRALPHRGVVPGGRRNVPGARLPISLLCMCVCTRCGIPCARSRVGGAPSRRGGGCAAAVYSARFSPRFPATPPRVACVMVVGGKAALPQHPCQPWWAAVLWPMLTPRTRSRLWGVSAGCTRTLQPVWLARSCEGRHVVARRRRRPPVGFSSCGLWRAGVLQHQR
jgi:hypothetical protein